MTILWNQFPDPDTGECIGTCGKEHVGYVIFTVFLCMSNFILLNLVMAVLMQELHVCLPLLSQTPQITLKHPICLEKSCERRRERESACGCVSERGGHRERERERKREREKERERERERAHFSNRAK